MESKQGLKIRALPRSNEKSASVTPEKDTAKPKAIDSSSSGKRWIVYVGAVSFSVLIAVLSGALLLSYSHQVRPKISTTSLASLQRDVVNDRVSRHMQVSVAREEILKKRHELEDRELLRAGEDSERDDDRLALNSGAIASGVQMDDEETNDRLYRDLNDRRLVQSKENSPDDRINARLANRKWINEHERAERIQFVRNYIRSAYDQGYEVEIDQNLTVVGVKRIARTKRLSIDEVLNRIGQ